MKIKFGHILAVACGLACISFSVSCTSTDDGSEDTSLDSSMTEAENDTAVGGDAINEDGAAGDESDSSSTPEDGDSAATLEDTTQNEEERTAAFEGEGAEEAAPTLGNETDEGAESSFEQGSADEGFDAPAESDTTEEFDPFAGAGSTEPTPAGDVSEDTEPVGSIGAEPSEAVPGESADSEEAASTQSADADPFARFDGLINNDGDSADSGNYGADEPTTGTDPYASAGGEPGAASKPTTAPSLNRSSTPSSLDESSNIRYLVAPGDNLYEIANRIYGNNREWMNIAQTNSLSAPFVIYPGDELEIPAFGAAAQFAQAYQDVPETVVTVQAGDSLYSIAQKVLGNGSAWKYIWKSNQDSVPNPDLLSPGQVLRFKDYRSAPQASL